MKKIKRFVVYHDIISTFAAGMIAGAIGSYTGVCVSDSSGVKSMLVLRMIVMAYMIAFIAPVVIGTMQLSEKWYREELAEHRWHASVRKR